MSKNTARIKRLAEALEAGLVDLQSTGSCLAIAVWSDADADAGYLVHRDGRMMPLGEYQYGFSSVAEMKAAALADEDTEVAQWAREEIGRVASSMETYDDAGNDEEDLRERISYAFLVDSDREVVVSAISNGMGMEQVFDLYASRPQSRSTTYAQDTFREATLERDMEVALLVEGNDGQPQWSVETLARKGEKVAVGSETENPDMRLIAQVNHPQFGNVGVIMKEGDYSLAPEPVRSVGCHGRRP